MYDNVNENNQDKVLMATSQASAQTQTLAALDRQVPEALVFPVGNMHHGNPGLSLDRFGPITFSVPPPASLFEMEPTPSIHG
jgi:hypothetical protein